MTIELPGYTALVESEVFEKIKHPNSPSKDMTEVASLMKFKAPTQEATLEFIKRKVKELCPRIEEEIKSSPLYSCSNVTEVLYEFLEGRGRLFEHLKLHTQNPNNQRSYLAFGSSLILDSKLDDLKREAQNTRINYNNIHGPAKKKMTIVVKLTDGGLLPSMSDLEHLLSSEVTHSSVLKISTTNYRGAASRLRLLQGILDSPEAMAQVSDKSQEILERDAAYTLKSTLKCYVGHALEGAAIRSSFMGMSMDSPFSNN